MHYKLESFNKTPFPLEVEVNIRRVDSKINLIYELIGTVAEVKNLNTPTATGTRADELWKSTCFEWFAKSNHSSKYWEFNSSTSGQWNFYQLDGYRKNLQPSESLATPQLASHLRSTLTPKYEFAVSIDLEGFLNNEKIKLNDLFFAVTAVIQWKTGETSYFSLKHPHEKPDFHHPCGFILNFSQELK